MDHKRRRHHVPAMRRLTVLFIALAAGAAFSLLPRFTAIADEPAPMMIQQAAGSAVTATAMIGSERREDDLPAIAAAPDGSLWAVWLSYADRRDEIGLRQYRNGRWGNFQRAPGTSGDVWLPQVGVDAQNRAWVVWSEQREDNWDLA